MTDKTLNHWLKRLKEKKTLTKTEIQSLNKAANSMRWLDREPERRENICYLLKQVAYGVTERTITKEQSQYGIEYLNRRYFKKDGSLRKKTYEVLGDREIDIIRNFKKFTFVGLTEEQINGWTQYSIVYRVYGQNGMHFDYIPMHWGEIKVVAL